MEKLVIDDFDALRKFLSLFLGLKLEDFRETEHGSMRYKFASYDGDALTLDISHDDMKEFYAKRSTPEQLYAKMFSEKSEKIKLFRNASQCKTLSRNWVFMRENDRVKAMISEMPEDKVKDALASFELAEKLDRLVSMSPEQMELEAAVLGV